MASISSDISISGWATTASNLLDARVNQPWALSYCWRNQPAWRRTARTTPRFLLTQPQVPGKRQEMAPTGVHGRHNNSHKLTTSCPSLGAKCSRHKPLLNNYGHMPWQPRNWTPTSLVYCRQNKAGQKHSPLPACLAHLFQNYTQ